MATRYNEVQDPLFYDVNDIMRITGRKKSKAYAIIAEINESRKALGKHIQKGRVSAAAFRAAW